MSRHRPRKIDEAAIRKLTTHAVDAIMDNKATAIGRVGEFSVAALVRNVDSDIHAVATIEARHNDVKIDIYNDWGSAKEKFGKLIRGD